MSGICAWHRADAFHAEQHSLGLQWKGKERKKVASVEWRDIADSWWDLYERGLGFVSLWARQSAQCECVAPHVCLCTLSRRRMYRLRSTPWFWCHPGFSHKSRLSSLPQMFTQDRHKWFLSKDSKREVEELKTPPSPQVHSQAWCRSQQPHARVALHWGDSFPSSPGKSGHKTSTLKH